MNNAFNAMPQRAFASGFAGFNTTRLLSPLSGDTLRPSADGEKPHPNKPA